MLFSTFLFAFLLLSNPSIALASIQQEITGSVRDVDGVPIPGVYVEIKGTSHGTATDIDGNYSIEASTGDIIVFSFLGFKTQEVTIDEDSVIDITMEDDQANLDEVIVTGYMKQKKADLTGAITTVSSEDITKSSQANVMRGLQGKLPGVQITGDGSPAGNTNIEIRGLTSLRSAPPLLVIDGLPSNMNLNDISANDIESIQILKDAASASIYGSRAASGVILIETKKGSKTDGPKFDYNAYFGVSHMADNFNLMNTEEYGRTLWQAAINDGSDPNAMTQIYNYEWHTNDNGVPVLDQLSPVEWLNENTQMRSADTDWFKEGTQLGIQTNHNITVKNGTDKSRTLLSLNYYENEGTQIHSMFRRFSVRFNSDYKLLNDKLTIGENISLSNVKHNNQDATHSLLTMPSIVPVYTEEGEWGGTATNLGMDDYNNPVRQLTLNKNNYSKTNKLIGNLYISLDLLKNLNLRSSYGIDYTATNYRHIDFTWHEGGGRHDENNGVRSYNGRDFTQTWTNTINYSMESGKHKFDAVVGLETVDFHLENFQGYRRDLVLENYDYAYLDAATGNQEANGNGDSWSLLSYFSKLNYVFDEKYLFSATFRYDGSSKFGRENRYGFFPALSGGWRISEENFMKNINFLSDLKLRASWGKNGNSNIPTNALNNLYDANYQQTGYGLKGNESGELLSGFRKIHKGNQSLRWETTTQTNIGVDFGFFDGSLSGSLDFFLKSTKDMLNEPPYLAAIGEGAYQWVNGANMTNKGVEFIATYYGDIGEDFSYSITGNISSFRNKITSLPDAVKFSYGGNGIDDDIIGRPLNSIYGFVADGLFKTDEEVENSAEQPGKGLGRIRYKDLDNDGRITNEQDRTWLGNSDPDFSYGLNFEAKYKGLDFSMFWQGIVGNQIINDWKTYSDFWNVWTQQGFNHSRRLLNAWTPQNFDSDIPAVSLINPNDEKRISSYLVESGSYLKLRQIEVGYTLPSDFTSKIGIDHFRIYVNAQNLINIYKSWGDDAFTGIDPETSSKSDEYADPYVIPQVFLLGVNLSF